MRAITKKGGAFWKEQSERRRVYVGAYMDDEGELLLLLFTRPGLD